MRSIAGIIVGYAVLFVFFFVTFTTAFFRLGVDFIFQHDSYLVTPLWLIITAAISLVGSMLAGYVCAAISKSKGACELLATLVLAILILFCIPKMRNPTPQFRSGTISSVEAMRLTQMPTWMLALNPILAALGVILGARKRYPKALPGLT